MFDEKLWFILRGAVTFPFRKFQLVKDIFLATLIINLGVSVVAILVIYLSKLEFKYYEDYVIATIIIFITLIANILVLLVKVSYMVGIIRAVVLNETADSSVLRSLFSRRQLSFMWSYLKVFLILAPLFFPIMMTEDFQFDGLKLGPFLFKAGWVLFLSFLAIRWFLVPAFAALDKGASLMQSWEITKGNFWLITISAAISSVPILLLWFLFFLGGYFIFILGGEGLINILSNLNYIMIYVLFAPISVFFTLAILMWEMAVFGYIYLAVTNQDKSAP